jgi:surfactin synthase thioesterase subunit/acyl carrier protein
MHRTDVGKIGRESVREAYLAGRLAAVKAPEPAARPAPRPDRSDDTLGELSEWPMETPLYDMGLDSLQLTQLAARLYERCGIRLKAEDLFSRRTLSEILELSTNGDPDDDGRSPWFPLTDHGSERGTRLYCIPGLGMSARDLGGLLGKIRNVEVRLVEPPGRSDRMAESSCLRLSELAEGLASALESESGRPYALFGVSMGAVVAFEAARVLRRRGAPAPVRLFPFCFPAPQLPKMKLEPFALIWKGGFGRPKSVERVRALAAASDSLWSLVSPWCDDLQVYDSYRYEPEDPFSFPITCLGGEADPAVSRSDLEAWRSQTTGAFDVRLFPGGHGPQLIDKSVDAIAAALSGALVR